MSRNKEAGLTAIEIVVSLAVFAMVIVGLYGAFKPTFSTARSLKNRLELQQDARLAMDRLAQTLRESDIRRVAVYSGGGAIGFVTTRPNCTGGFTMDPGSGGPVWQAMVYVVHDAGSSELRRYCDVTSTFPSGAPVTSGGFAVLARHVQSVTFTLNAASVTIALHERTPTGDIDRHVRTEFAPRNQ